MLRGAVEAAGIPVTRKGSKQKGYLGHGLRKASATIAVESGASEAELNAMFGWSGHEMAQLYTRKADRKKLAARAMEKWTRPSSEDVAGESATGKERGQNAPRTLEVTTFQKVVTLSKNIAIKTRPGSGWGGSIRTISISACSPRVFRFASSV